MATQTTGMDIRAFGPDDHDAVLGWVEVVNAVRAYDCPWALPHPLTAPAATARLTHGWDGEPPRAFLGSIDGVPLVAGTLMCSERDNRHAASLGVEVTPDRRGHWLGSTMLAVLESEAAARGRTTLVSSVFDDTDGEAFARSQGYERVHVGVNRRQHLADVDPAAVRRMHDAALAASAGYELVRVEGRIADDELDDVATMTAAINDAPRGGLDLADETFTGARLRAYEDAQRARGQRVHRLMARHVATGELVGQSVVAVDAESPAHAEQHDTSVVATHRGHRLGALLKTGMMAWLAEAEPQVRLIDTWNAESNRHMIGVNDALGYRVMGREVMVQKAQEPQEALPKTSSSVRSV